MRKTLICLLTAASLGLAACGGDDEDAVVGANGGDPVLASWVAKADEACQKLYDETVSAVAKVRSLEFNEAELEDEEVVESKLSRVSEPFIQIGRALDELSDELRALPAPAGELGEAVQGYVANVTVESAAAIEAGDQAVKNQYDGYEGARERFARARDKLRTYARDLGLKVCSRGAT